MRALSQRFLKHESTIASASYRESLAMDAKDDGMENPFADTLLSLAWIASAMEAARRHAEDQRGATPGDPPDAVVRAPADAE
jgi:hypothetical protein